MSRKTDWRLLARYLSGEGSESDRERVETWIDADPRNRVWMDSMRRIWTGGGPSDDPSDIEELWLDTARRAGIQEGPEVDAIPDRPHSGRADVFSPPIHRPFRRRALAFAVSLTTVLALAFIIWRSLGGPSPAGSWLALTVPHGEQSRLNLDDGTEVALDSGTVLRYPEKFGKGEREVTLKGEAFFKVTSDRERPFVVHAGQALIRVLGTEFNIRFWERENRVEVGVQRGRVRLTGASSPGAASVVIGSGQWSVLTEEGDLLPPKGLDPDAIMSWGRREAVFADTPLSHILDQLERWYDLRIVLTDRSVGAERLTLHLEDRPVGDILELIAALTEMRFERRGQTVVFRPRE